MRPKILNMAYTKNPEVAKVRGQAADLVRRGWSVRKVARHFGYSHSAVVKWVARSKKRGSGPIPTRSSRPKSHPHALGRNIIHEIIKERIGRRRCAEHVHRALLKKGVVVSLSSVKRTLDRLGLLKKRSLWKRPHDYTERPEALYSGALLETDTVHIMLSNGERLYIYTIIDLFSRWAYAEAVERISSDFSFHFVSRARAKAPFKFEMVQTDNGPEFQKMFRFRISKLGMKHRYSRVRQSNDQAHIERFNRTIQEECLDRTTHNIVSFRAAIPKYLKWYNSERSHMGIDYKTPLEMVPSY